MPEPREIPDAPRWMWSVPAAGFALLLVAIGALLWLLQRSDVEDQRAGLIRDLLWVEQDLRFHLSKLQDVLEELGRDSAAGVLDPARREARARFLIKNHPWLERVAWHGPDLGLLAAVPSARAGNARPPELEAARALGKPLYSPPVAEEGGYRVTLHVPIFQAGNLVGVMTGDVALEALLRKGIPWWHAEQYQLRLIDLGGDVLASRSSLQPDPGAANHRVAFDPPGHGVFLEAVAYPGHGNQVRNGLAAAIVALMLAVLWSLQSLRRHGRSRDAAERALREQSAFRAAMEDSLQTGLRARDLSGRITYVNPAFCRMVGWSAEELLGRGPPMPYWIDADLESTSALNEAILAGLGPKEGFEMRFKRRDGEMFWALIHEAPLVDSQGRQAGWMSSVVDITAQKQAEARERQQQERLQASARLIAMGEMASSMAHELNQPLAAISSYAAGSLNLMRDGRAEPDELQAVLAKIQAQAQRAGRVIRRIYEFVRRAEPKSEPCDLAALVTETADLLEPDAQRQRVRLRLCIASDLPRVTGDRVLLAQAVLNLMRNGMEAMRDSPEERRELRIQLAAEGGRVRADISDLGPGIAPEARERLFEPFFTTKPDGMGMGLNITRTILEAHHGRLEAGNPPEGGARFTFTLPAAHERDE